MTRTALYRHFDAEGQLLYVGISNNPIYRLHQHQAADWFFDIANVKIEWLGSFEDALIAEAEAIAAERPKHNKTHNATGDVGGFISAVGRDNLGRRLGVGRSAISNAIQKNKMPCMWSRVVAQLCRERELYVPVDAFPFKGVTVDRRCITELLQEPPADIQGQGAA